MLFDDHDRAAGEELRSSPVAKAEPSQADKSKAKKKITDDGLPVHSFRTLLADLATLTRNAVKCGKAPEMTLLARPTEIQHRALGSAGRQIAGVVSISAYRARPAQSRVRQDRYAPAGRARGAHGEAAGRSLRLI
jgi:hypothetical protein